MGASVRNSGFEPHLWYLAVNLTLSPQPRNPRNSFDRTHPTLFSGLLPPLANRSHMLGGGNMGYSCEGATAAPWLADPPGSCAFGFSGINPTWG